MSTKTDIQSLQDLVVSALEDVKGKDIVVFDTEHLSALFERVIIVSGSSNRQTKALASSVRDEVRDAGLPKPRVEGEDNGEWIIVDCGAAVVHVMQPIIREYYRLEEIWGDKPVRIKQAKARGLVKASEPMDQDKAAPKKAAAKKPAASKSAPAKPVPAKKAAAKKTPAKPVAGKKVAAKKLPANTSKPKTVTVNKPKAAAKKVVKPAVKIPTKRVAVKAAAKPAAKTTAKPAAKKPSAKPAAKPVAKSAAKPAVKTPAKKPALKKPAAKKTK